MIGIGGRLLGRQAYVGDNIKRDLQEVGWGSMVRIDLAQNRNTWWAFVNAVMSLEIP